MTPPRWVWVLPEGIILHGHCAPRCFPSYRFQICVPCPTRGDRA
nr:MAG TPA: hypothetical protein [Caudoviricetes sp.]